MKNIETKQDKVGEGVPANNEKIFASEINSISTELENAVVASGTSLDESNNYQLARSITDHALGGRYSVDTGTVNNYILSITGSRYAPTTLVDGYVLEFFTGNANTTTTPTLNYATIGVKTIVAENGTDAILAGDIKVGTLNRVVYNGTNWRLILPTVPSASQTVAGISYLNKQITIANNVTDANNDIDFTSGTFAFSNYTGMASVGAMTKRLDASWTAGTNQGGLDIGSKANSTWYHCYAIHNPTSGVSDAIFSTNATTPTLPSGYTKYKLIESILTNLSGNIYAFYHEGNYISWKTKIKDIVSGLSTSLTPYPISTPLGRSVMVKVRATLFTGGISVVNILSPYDNSLIPISTECDLVSQNYTTSIEKEVITNTSSQISIIASAAPVSSFTLFTYGWEKIN